MEVQFKGSLSKADGESLGRSHWCMESHISQKCACLSQKGPCCSQALAGGASEVKDFRQHDRGLGQLYSMRWEI